MSIKYKYSSSNLLFLKTKYIVVAKLIHTHILNFNIHKNRVNEYIKNLD